MWDNPSATGYTSLMENKIQIDADHDEPQNACGEIDSRHLSDTDEASLSAQE